VANALLITTKHLDFGAEQIAEPVVEQSPAAFSATAE
jgi:hypothetical protein